MLAEQLNVMARAADGTAEHRAVRELCDAVTAAAEQRVGGARFSVKD